MKRLLLLLAVVCAAVLYPVHVPASQPAGDAEGEKINPKQIIFEHLGDGYGWEVPFNHHVRIPLPVIEIGRAHV